MTCIRPGDCAVWQGSIRDPFGSSRTDFSAAALMQIIADLPAAA